MNEYPITSKIFVFGSNLAGRHGRGAALDAYKHYGAKWGRGIGHHGRSYGIPTKDQKLKVLSLEEILTYVDKFIAYAIVNNDMEFFVTKIGCGLAGYTDADISPMFGDAPYNCELPVGWRKY